MVNINGRFCIDRFEASLDVVDGKGRTVRRHSPFHTPEEGLRVAARSRPGVVPQAYVSQRHAQGACELAGKRLCTDAEWVAACRGRTPTRYPYGEQHVDGRCNDHGTSPLRKLYGRDEGAFGFEPMNDPRLNQVPGSVARTGAFKRCRGAYGVLDMVGNLHEWTADPGGTFRGGYYLDTVQNGEGCDYRTTAHDPGYHDYSIGFRCCSRLGGERQQKRKPAPTRRAD
jgi:formylglycine-generating enzyme required for sulfatase activity